MQIVNKMHAHTILLRIYYKKKICKKHVFCQQTFQKRMESGEILFGVTELY